jgi:hypothetical protein
VKAWTLKMLKLNSIRYRDMKGEQCR